MSFLKEKINNLFFFTHVPVLKNIVMWVIFVYSLSSCALFKPVIPAPANANEQVFLNEKEEEVETEKEIDRKSIIPYWKRKSINLLQKRRLLPIYR